MGSNDSQIEYNVARDIRDSSFDSNILKLLEGVTKKSKVVEDGKIELEFKDGTTVQIASKIEGFNILISDSTMYLSGESCETLISKDRLMYYLSVLGSEIALKLI